MSTAAGSIGDATREIRALDAEFERLANARSVDALVEAFYAEDAHLLPPHAPRVNGKAALRDFWKNFFAAINPSDVKLQTDEISSSGDLAYGVGKYSFTASGSQQTGKYVVVYRRERNGGYKAVVDSFSPDS
ncbi:MAG TPA: nuclear transport factor 2 family protein [Bryobacteraceae bacterium]|nr:nuclear transport factor 2 family protein [Bryobacteraceae bacterium]